LVQTENIPPLAASVLLVNAKDAAWVDSKTTPQPTHCFTQKIKVTGAYQSIGKKRYISERCSLRAKPLIKGLNSAAQIAFGNP
jgi:hypothetical protein